MVVSTDSLLRHSRNFWFLRGRETTASGGKRRQITDLAVLVAFNIRPDLNKPMKRFHFTKLFQVA